VRYFDIDPKAKDDPLQSRASRSLAALPGTLAVGIDPDDPSPRKGGQGAAGAGEHAAALEERLHMDINEMTEGTTIFIPCSSKAG